MTDKITEARQCVTGDSTGWGFAAEYIEEHEARIAAEARAERAEADLDHLRSSGDARAELLQRYYQCAEAAEARSVKAEADAVSYLRVIADIRRASGLGDAPMLSELAEAVGALTTEAARLRDALQAVHDDLLIRGLNKEDTETKEKYTLVTIGSHVWVQLCAALKGGDA